MMDGLEGRLLVSIYEALLSLNVLNPNLLRGIKEALLNTLGNEEPEILALRECVGCVEQHAFEMAHV